MSETGYAIQTAGLTKIFRDFWGHQKVVAVNDLSLEIRPKEVYGLLGPNGSGKSTTIKLLLGLLFPSRGWAKILGEVPGDVKTNSRIGYLPEESYLYPYLNARETLSFYGRLFGLSRAERRRRIDSLLDMVGLSAAARRPIAEFSKGMIRRIGLAQALINDPEVLILDEPTSGLDPIGSRQIKDLIRELGNRGKTVLMCSHQLADVEDICDRIAILYGGKLLESGAVNDLLARKELTQIVSGRLSASAMERIGAIIREDTHSENFEVQTPREDLERYFLDKVAQAQKDQLATSGAAMGGRVSEFLGETTRPAETNLLETLLVGKEVPAPAPRPLTEVIPVEEKPRAEVLESLLESQTRKVTPVKPAAIKPEEKPETGAVDQDLIQNLLRDKKKKT